VKAPGELLAEARRLEKRAVDTGEDGAEGRELLANAADLRRKALGEKAYPVLACSSCLRVTGWTDAEGRCDSCLRRAQREAAYADPHGGWVALDDTRPEPEQAPAPPPLGARIQALLGRRSALDHALAAAWMRRVDPDRTGPIEPEDGYELESAEREELPAADGSGLVVRFSTATRRFADGGWTRLESSRLGRADHLVPLEFSAGLPIEQLAEAWADFRGEVETFNRAAWARASSAREAERQAREARALALAEQRDVAELLDDGS
jgi:hypothetical protein